MSDIWQRMGPVLTVRETYPWWKSHVQLPTVLVLSDHLWRVYFSGRDADNRGCILAVDVDPAAYMRVVSKHFEPLLTRAGPGAFDQAGVSPASVLVVDRQVYLYYIGIFVRADVRGQTSIGLAVSSDGLNFERAFDGPVHGIGPHDPYFTSAPSVLATSEGYRMWYVGGHTWREVDGLLDIFCEVRTTQSKDGRIWDQRSETVLPFRQGTEAGFGRPHVLEHNGVRLLYCSTRGDNCRTPGSGAYRLASASLEPSGSVSAPAAPLALSPPPAEGDFDSWMQTYPCVLRHRDDLVMFYNGNDFGMHALGWARLPGGAGRLGLV